MVNIFNLYSKRGLLMPFVMTFSPWEVAWWNLHSVGGLPGPVLQLWPHLHEVSIYVRSNFPHRYPLIHPHTHQVFWLKYGQGSDSYPCKPGVPSAKGKHSARQCRTFWLEQDRCKCVDQRTSINAQHIAKRTGLVMELLACFVCVNL